MKDEVQFKNILKETDKLIELAELGEWEQVIELEIIRDGSIKKFFNNQIDIDQHVLQEGLQYIIDKNNLLMKYSHSQRDSLQLEMSKAGHAHQAINKYLDN